MKVSTDACVFGAWVAEQIKKEQPVIQTVLDIGTGTGLLPLMMAQVNADIRITSVEIDPAAAKQASENISRTHWKNRVEIYQTDIKEFISKTQFDCIVSNPPFYEGDLTGPDVRKNQAHHNASLNFSELVATIDRLLDEWGTFYLLLPMKMLEERLEILSANQLHVHQKVSFKHSAAHPATRVFLKGGRKRMEPLIMNEICLMEKENDHSAEARQLLGAFYLAL